MCSVKNQVLGKQKLECTCARESTDRSFAWLDGRDWWVIGGHSEVRGLPKKAKNSMPCFVSCSGEDLLMSYM